MRKSRLLKETRNTNRMLSTQYELLQKTYTDNAMLFHDMNNHLQTIYHMAEDAGNMEIQTYVSRISSPVRDMASILWSGVGIVDAILNDKMKIAAKKGYSVQIDAELPSNTGIAPEDFCTILSNLLDNAIEALDRETAHSPNPPATVTSSNTEAASAPSACNPAVQSQSCSGTDSASPQIKVSLRRINHFLMIRVSNPCTEERLPKKGLFTSLKPDRFRHGWGLKSIKKAVAKYNGNFSCGITAGSFVATAMLFFPREDTDV